MRDDDPVLVVENLPIYKEKGEVPLDPEFLTPIGRANVAREGSDITSSRTRSPPCARCTPPSGWRASTA